MLDGAGDFFADVFGVYPDHGGLERGDLPGVQRCERHRQAADRGGIVQIFVGGRFGHPQRHCDFGGQVFSRARVMPGQPVQFDLRPGGQMGRQCLPGDHRVQYRVGLPADLPPIIGNRKIRSLLQQRRRGRARDSRADRGLPQRQPIRVIAATGPAHTNRIA